MSVQTFARDAAPVVDDTYIEVLTINSRKKKVDEATTKLRVSYFPFTFKGRKLRPNYIWDDEDVVCYFEDVSEEGFRSVLHVEVTNDVEQNQGIDENEEFDQVLREDLVRGYVANNEDIPLVGGADDSGGGVLAMYVGEPSQQYPAVVENEDRDVERNASRPILWEDEIDITLDELLCGEFSDAVITPATQPKLIQTGCTMPIRPEKDICSLFEPYQLNDEDSRQETTWKLLSAQLKNASKKNQSKRSSYEGVIQFTSWVIPSLPDLDIHGVIGGFRPDQKELSYKGNFPKFLTHERLTESWNEVNTNFCLGDINFLNRKIPDLPYLEPVWFGRLQSHVWRPGEFQIQLEAPNIT
ncbi:MULE transposase N-terminal all-beta domain [Arabidopsis suecica]|uniref:MULE transposase N-terminal all-beta domain n=1 Tax=Arabidopsis suecica TaxID=45249 RepID=A0A8T2BD87_ARASU|nr:MULE transposase N-terminal all-beta domain [Arabidopsis suecica]